ncbi:hypothetical protein DDE82_002298 [Stemphylium lycopersici]|uniref:Uncharacterized protein n=1 Tax=Stemphylium lycopersici TaxID=183478 RepID=A0A364NGG9_STELY|nr:hypothetical protein TW65_08227 [Stemphylium lycopersici]RAR08318.1 hypothetical protein DDE82_002298 [Stemphylium lycopersici]RAR16379.1 hypothetical protein DDE83_000252 [Stemphylium lycopersici]
MALFFARPVGYDSDYNYTTATAPAPATATATTTTATIAATATLTCANLDGANLLPLELSSRNVARLQRLPPTMPWTRMTGYSSARVGDSDWPVVAGP